MAGSSEGKPGKHDKFILMTDLEGNTNILISGYAEHSIAPLLSLPQLRGWKEKPSRTKILVDANGDIIPVYEYLTYSNLDLGVGKKLRAKFGRVHDKLFYRILGNDFLRENDLSVDFEKKTLTYGGYKGKTAKGTALPHDLKAILYPKDGVVQVMRGDGVEAVEDLEAEEDEPRTIIEVSPMTDSFSDEEEDEDTLSASSSLSRPLNIPFRKTN